MESYAVQARLIGLRHLPETRLQGLLEWLTAAVGGDTEDIVALLGRPHRHRRWLRLSDAERVLFERIETCRAEWLSDFKWDHLTYFCQDLARCRNSYAVGDEHE